MLKALLQDAGDDIEQAKKNVEAWFDDQMERVSGWYKRKLQLIIVFWSIIIAFALNADTFVLADSLSTNPKMAATIAATAQDFISASDQATTSSGSGKVITTTASDTETLDPGMSQLKDLTIGQLKDQLDQLALPLGWQLNGATCDDWYQFWGNLGGCSKHLLGLIVTGILVFFGAPFWFDMLDKLVSQRGSGKKPLEKEEQPISK